MKRAFFLAIFLIVFIEISIAQNYLDTHVSNKYFLQNTFIDKSIDFNAPSLFYEIRDQLPQPDWEGHESSIDLYWRAWEIAFSNLKVPTINNGFISPYIDPAFNGHIFMWDCSFMTMFGKYGYNTFNFQKTLDNFYTKQHKDGFICREIRGNDGSDVFERFDPASTGPNIMPWSEWEFYLNIDDSSRLAAVFPVLLGYYQWYQTYRSWPDGSYFSSGWGCGMDNQPRMHPQYHSAWSHGFMSWIDISCQEVFAGNILIKMAKELGREKEVESIAIHVNKLQEFINKNMWNEEESYYFDRYRDGSLSDLKSIASYWALVSGVVPPERINSFVNHLSDTNKFARLHRVPSLSADNKHFNSDGDYWNGSIWAPTNYMVLRGLTNYKQDSLAFEIARNHLQNVVQVFEITGEIHENYAPDKIQGNDKKDFVGWTGLVPINVLFEYVFGIRPNVPEQKLIIDVRLTDSYGIKNYPFGKTGVLNIDIAARKSNNVKPKVSIESNIPLLVVVRWKNGEYILTL
jgi:hypothetical protein